ncbi:dihydrofolate reductase family protein [Aureimonas leprariae]|uniref:RibD family protein n=1 Tax=Plantimonas leprariae TaxID=2615207 RepID=A0A7V7TXL5_9HYPH|nr:RibD family protein [Aureimonas leprariae]KAB0681476.1 RibD family protein [Aureimonas leprariae]
MKPHVICHMVSSVDGRILHSRWSPKANGPGDLFERLHDKLEGDAWLVGRVTGSEFAKRDGAYPPREGSAPERVDTFVRRDAPAYGVVVDAEGKVAFGRADIGGDPIVVLLTEQVSDDHLAGLAADGVSYIFAGEREVDFAAALDTLNRELGIRRLLVEGGGTINGAFLRAGLVDEVSLAICPALDGAKGAPSVFDSRQAIDGPSAPIGAMRLQSCEMLDGGAVWLRYVVETA